MTLPAEAQQLFSALLDTIGAKLEPGQSVTLHVDNEGELGMVEFSFRLRKQKPLAPSQGPAHTQPRTQEFLGRRSVMR